MAEPLSQAMASLPLKPEADQLVVVLHYVRDIERRPVAAKPFVTSEEQRRALRFVRQGDHNRFLLARGLLRQILGKWLNIDPKSVALTFSEFGKPSLADPNFAEALSFNASHSGDLIGLVFALGQHNIGIDVEILDRSESALEVAGRFHADEQTAIQACPEPDRFDRFIQIWTRKEAMMKADGRGVNLPLDSFSALSDHADTWQIRDIDTPRGFRGAVAYETRSEISQIVHWPSASLDDSQ